MLEQSSLLRQEGRLDSMTEVPMLPMDQARRHVGWGSDIMQNEGLVHS